MPRAVHGGGRGGGADAATHPRVEIAVRQIDPGLAAQVSYVRQIKPILTDNCLDCHSAEEHKSGLDASSVSALLKGGKKAGPAIVPGKPDESALVQFVAWVARAANAQRQSAVE